NRASFSVRWSGGGGRGVQAKRAASSSSAATRSRAVRRNERPVGVARVHRAGEGPEIGLLLDLVGIAVDDRAIRFAGNVDLVGDEAHRHLRDVGGEIGL